MSDLRTRIAAAIESIRIQRDGDAARMADAVIAELRPQLVAWARMCVDGGDMTPAAQRMLHKIIGADRELRRIKAQQAAAFHRRGSNLLKGDDEQT